MQTLHQLLSSKGLKVTPQRLAVYEAVVSMRTHPTADKIIAYVQHRHPNIAVGTIYNVLEALVDKGLVQRVKTEKDIMRYDAVLDKHHHLYCSQTGEILDYYNEELTELIEQYLEKKHIPDFEVHDIKLQISGKIKTTT